MKSFDEILRELESVGKKELRACAPENTQELLEIIKSATPGDEITQKMALGYLTSICAEHLHPEPLILEQKIDFTGIELEKGHIIIRGDAGKGTGTAMRGGKITIEGSAGKNTGKSMSGGEIEANTIEHLSNTLGGVVKARKIHAMDKTQNADIYINGKKYKKGLLTRLRQLL